MDGASLKKLRLSKRLRLIDVARQYGGDCGHVWIGRIEATRNVKRSIAEKYQVALERAFKFRKKSMAYVVGEFLARAQQ